MPFVGIPETLTVNLLPTIPRSGARVIFAFVAGSSPALDSVVR